MKTGPKFAPIKMKKTTISAEDSPTGKSFVRWKVYDPTGELPYTFFVDTMKQAVEKAKEMKKSYDSLFKRSNPIGPVIKLPNRFKKIPADLIKHTIAEAEKAIGSEKSHRTLRSLTIKVLDKLLRNARK